MTAELAIIADGGGFPGHPNDNINHLAELSPSCSFAKRAIVICEFLRERRASEAETANQEPQSLVYGTREDLDDDSTGLMVAGNHVQTFFRPYDQDRSFEKRASRPPSHENLTATSLGSPYFLLQTNPLKKILPVFPQDRGDEDATEKLRQALKAHGLMFLDQSQY